MDSNRIITDEKYRQECIDLCDKIIIGGLSALKELGFKESYNKWIKILEEDGK